MAVGLCGLGGRRALFAASERSGMEKVIIASPATDSDVVLYSASCQWEMRRSQTQVDAYLIPTAGRASHIPCLLCGPRSRCRWPLPRLAVRGGSSGLWSCGTIQAGSSYRRRRAVSSRPAFEHSCAGIHVMLRVELRRRCAQLAAMAAPGRKSRSQIAALRSQSERGRYMRTWLQVSLILDQMRDGRSDAPFCLLRPALSLKGPLPSSAFLHLRADFRTFSGSRSKYHVRAAFRRCKESHQSQPIVPRPLERSAPRNP